MSSSEHTQMVEKITRGLEIAVAQTVLERLHRLARQLRAAQIAQHGGLPACGFAHKKTLLTL